MESFIDMVARCTCVQRLWWENDYLLRRRIKGKKANIFFKIYGITVHHFQKTKELKLAGEVHGVTRRPFETNKSLANRLNKRMEYIESGEMTKDQIRKGGVIES